MTPSDDILDLLGRYATGSLSAEEQKRLFDAALDDQDLFEQLVREQEMKSLLDEPGARDRMIHALTPPKRNTAWIFGIAATVALSVVLVVVLSRPKPKPREVAVANIPAPAATVQPANAPPPVTTPTPAPEPAKQRDSEVKSSPPAPIVETEKSEAPKPKAAEPRREASATSAGVAEESQKKDALKKETDSPVVAVASSAPPPAVRTAAPAARAKSADQVQVQAAPQQQNAVGGPRQNASQVVGGLFDAKTSAVGIHYSLEIPGHLTIIPGIDGFLSVKSNDGTVLYGPKLSAAGIIVDIPLSDAATSLAVTFSENSSPVQTKPTVYTTPTGTVQGASNLAIQIKLKP